MFIDPVNLSLFRVVAIFGSSPLLVDSSVASVCSALKVPYLTSHPVLASAENIQARKFAIHLGPSQNDLIRAVRDTIDQLKWTELALLSHRETGKIFFDKKCETINGRLKSSVQALVIYLKQNPFSMICFRVELSFFTIVGTLDIQNCLDPFY